MTMTDVVFIAATVAVVIGIVITVDTVALVVVPMPLLDDDVNYF